MSAGIPLFSREEVGVRFNHRSVTKGYQNMTIAQNFVTYVEYKLKQKYPDVDLNSFPVNIFAGDLSSTVSAVLLKLRFPNWVLVGFSKNHPSDGFKIEPVEAAFNLFVDDYFAAGTATGLLFTTMKRAGYRKIPSEKLHLFYMDSYPEASRIEETATRMIEDAGLYTAKVLTVDVWAQWSESKR